jgi:geranylgeranylglycerol-phosphate geranylgeranyltransferase
MPPSWPASLAALVRLPNLVLTAGGVAVGGVLALGALAWPAPLCWAIAASAGIGAVGYVANDLVDLEADRLDHPGRPLPSGALSPAVARLVGGTLGGLGLAAAWVAGRAVFAIGLAALAVMLVYSPLLKRRGLVGNGAVAVVASLPLVFGAAAAGAWRAGLVPAGIAALLHLAREIVKDLEDVRGDATVGRRTVPLAYGAAAGFVAAAAALLLFVPVSLAPWLAGWYGARYGLSVAALNAGLAVLIARLLTRRLAGASLALKGAMVVGLAALLWDRL